MSGPAKLRRRLTITPVWRARSISRDRPHRSSSVRTKGDLKMDHVENEASSVSPSSLRKRHKPLVVKRVASRELMEPELSGYMERKSFSGQWVRYWYALKDGCLYCYLTSDDSITVDVLDLPGYKVTSMVDKFRGKRFILVLSHDTYTSTYLSMDTREEMEAWDNCLQKSVGLIPGTGVAKNGALANGKAGSDPQFMRQSIKQRLLEEMLRQKYELEQKQAARQKKMQQTSTKTCTLPAQFTADDQLLSDVTRLRQRRLSAQLKVETIQKQMQNNGQKKKLFSFGHKKQKSVENNKNQHLEEQLKEFAFKIERLDKDLDQCKKGSKKDLKQTLSNSSVRTTASDELNRSLEIMTIDPQATNGSIQRTNSIKASMQKFAQRTFLKTGRNRNNKKSNGIDTALNGDIPDSMKADFVYCAPMGSCEEEDKYHDDEQDSGYGLADQDSDSVTDLTKDISPHRLNDGGYNDSQFDLCHFNSSSSPKSSPRLTRSRRIGVTHMPSSPEVDSPRKQIDPSVMAEIDAFEELTRQMLSSRGESLPAT